MQNEDPELQRQRQIEYGREVLKKSGIDPEQYRDYFKIMAENDVPLINSLPTQMFITNEQELASAENQWDRLRIMYGKIDLSKQSEHTGKHIIEEMKLLIDKFDLEFKAYAANARKTSYFIFPATLAAIKKQIVDLAERYTEQVPAYRAYRWVGRFELDPDGKRGYQIREDQTE